ncbi:hypothetical protein [Glycomyces arizonensis]|uniref:hypothetical protein n=1 Tax=Glycomyces arizonensis TaxID=256035 RepID=UPI000405CF1F|nr:hypothetical protein [Glycomyces arizonensis]
MANVPHEALHHLFREEPGLFSTAMSRILNEEFPEVRAVAVLNSDLTEIKPLARYADTVLKVETDEGAEIIVIEPQTGISKKKLRSWAYYIAYLENKYELPVSLLVVTPNAATADWARRPISLGPKRRPSLRVLPFVLGPDNTPFITDPETAAEDIVLTVFAALTHRLDPDIEKALQPLAVALGGLDETTARFFAEFTSVGLGDGCAYTAWKRIIMSMTYPYASRLRDDLKAEGREEGREEGRAEGRAETVIAILNVRGIALTDAERERIMSCTDLTTLAYWAVRAASVERTEALFEV